MDAGCQHLFLADDDCWPLVDNWWEPYINSPEPHLMNIFANPNDPSVVATDRNVIAYTHPRGHMLYAHRSVIDRVADKNIIHKNKAARHKSRLSAAIKALA